MQPKTAQLIDRGKGQLRPLGRITRDAHAQEGPIKTRDSRGSIELLTIRQIGDIGPVLVFFLLKKTNS